MSWEIADDGHGECNVPSGSDFVAVAGGWYHSFALKEDGSLAAWGHNGDGQCNVPSGNDFAAVAGGSAHSLAIEAIAEPTSLLLLVGSVALAYRRIRRKLRNR